MQPEPLTAALEALRRHIYLEEVFLFPPIRGAGMVMPIFVMMREHGQLWHTMDTLRDLLADGTEHGRLGDTCSRLLDQLDQHNSKEEPVVIRVPRPTYHHRRARNWPGSSRPAAPPMDGYARGQVTKPGRTRIFAEICEILQLGST